MDSLLRGWMTQERCCEKRRRLCSSKEVSQLQQQRSGCYRQARPSGWEREDADSVSARPAPSQRRRARARRGRVADKDASGCVRATPRELSRGRRAARAYTTVPASASGVLRRGEGKEDSTSGARAMPSLQEMTAGKARLRNTPRAVRAPRRANPFRPSAPLRARPASCLPRAARAPRAKNLLRPLDRDPAATPRPRRTTAAPA